MHGRGFLALAAGLLLVAAVLGLGVGALTVDGSGADPGRGTPRSTSTPTPTPAGAVALAADRSAAAPGERVTLTGTVAGAGPGVDLVVQREEGGQWADFPAETTTGPGGQFTVYVELGRPGDNVLRVTDPVSGVVSDPVTVTVD